MTQCDEVLRLLRRGPITSLDALQKVGCLRLAARILDLRQRGHQIHSVAVPMGDRRTVARYHLVREARNVG